MINRRTLLFGAMATAVAACSSGSTQSAADGQDAGPSNVGGVDVGKTPANPPRGKVPKSIAVVGDSITARSQPAIEAVLTQVGFTTITVNAEPSRRIEVGSKKPIAGLDVVTFIEASSPPEMWVVALGTNDAGLYSQDSDYQGLIDHVLAAIPSKVPLVWMSTYRHDQIKGSEQFNLLIRSSLKARGNAVVGEWYQQVTKSKQAILTKDGVHPNADGILVFADTMRAAIATELA